MIPVEIPVTIRFEPLFSIYAPTMANTMCDAALTATTKGAVKKNPIVVPTAVKTAVHGEINIAIIIGTCAISVAE